MPTDLSCPYCLFGADAAYSCSSKFSCRVCGREDSHYHRGVRRPKACGPIIGFWIRLFRWCWLKEPHLHQSCSQCDGKWISPPLGVEGEPILKKPVRPLTRFERILKDKD